VTFLGRGEDRDADITKHLAWRFTGWAEPGVSGFRRTNQHLESGEERVAFLCQGLLYCFTLISQPCSAQFRLSIGQPR